MLFNKNFYGIIIKYGDIQIDQRGNCYREIQFQEVTQNKKFDGRKIYVRMFECVNIDIFDMIFCHNFRIFDKDNINNIRLERNFVDSQEIVGNEECRIFCDVQVFQKMKFLQECKRKCQNKLIQSRIDHYFKQ